MTQNLQALGELFTPFMDQIASTKRLSIQMTLSPASELSLQTSKVGGVPYWPKAVALPCNAKGQRLTLLAQINCAQLPDNDVYPKQGLLQFYIDVQDDLLGLNFEQPTLQQGFQVRYFENATDPAAEIGAVDDEDGYAPFNKQYQIAFQNTAQYISVGDVNFAPVVFGVQDVSNLDDTYPDIDFYEQVLDVYEQQFSAAGHRMGGYPYFTQSDPRYEEVFKDYVLLLQIDTDYSEGVDIMWGDSGVCNFFIHPDDLQNKDFSKVLYNWDCC